MKNGFRTLVPALILVLGASASAWAAEQTKDLEATPQGKTYREQEKAVKAGDYAAYKKTMTKASQAMMDKQTKEMNMDPKKAMEFMKAMLPTDLKFTSLSVDKNKGTMMATGKVAGEANKGTIEFEQEDGQWKIVKQSWTNAK
jgi:hypothetical protein